MKYKVIFRVNDTFKSIILDVPNKEEAIKSAWETYGTSIYINNIEEV